MCFQNRLTAQKVGSCYCSKLKIIISRIFDEINDQMYLLYSVASSTTDKTVAAELGYLQLRHIVTFCNALKKTLSLAQFSVPK